MLQIGPIILNTFWRIFLCKSPRDYAEVGAPRMFNYGWGYPTPVFLFVVLLVYSTSAPIILVFGTFYYALAYIVFKYQLLYGGSHICCTITRISNSNRNNYSILPSVRSSWTNVAKSVFSVDSWLAIV